MQNKYFTILCLIISLPVITFIGWKSNIAFIQYANQVESVETESYKDMDIVNANSDGSNFDIPDHPDFDAPEPVLRTAKKKGRRKKR